MYNELNSFLWVSHFDFSPLNQQILFRWMDFICFILIISDLKLVDFIPFKVFIIYFFYFVSWKYLQYHIEIRWKLFFPFALRVEMKKRSSNKLNNLIFTLEIRSKMSEEWIYWIWNFRVPEIKSSRKYYSITFESQVFLLDQKLLIQ